MPTDKQAAAIRAQVANAPRHRKPGPTKEQAYESLRIYKSEHLGPNDRPVTTHYMAACRRDSRLVWPSSLKRLTGKSFTKLLAEVGL
jgi:hypothetical protein